MNSKKLLFFFIFSIAVHAYAIESKPCGWIRVGNSYVSQTENYTDDLAINNKNNIFVAYSTMRKIVSHDVITKIVVKALKNHQWHSIGSVPIPSDSSADDESLQLGKNSSLYVAAQIYSKNKSPTIAVYHFFKKKWRALPPIPTKDSVTMSKTAFFVSNTNASKSIPYLFYLDNDKNTLNLLKFSNKKWHLVGKKITIVTGPVSRLGCIDLAIKLTSKNQPIIAYNIHGISVMKLGKDGKWKLTGYKISKATHFSLAVASNDLPYLAYYQYGNSGFGTIKVVKLSDDNVWEPIADPTFFAQYPMSSDPNLDNDVNLALSKSNVPFVTFSLNNDAGAIITAKLNAENKWSLAGDAKTAVDSGTAAPIIKLNKQDKPYVLYLSDTFRNSVMTIQ